MKSNFSQTKGVGAKIMLLATQKRDTGLAPNVSRSLIYGNFAVAGEGCGEIYYKVNILESLD